MDSKKKVYEKKVYVVLGKMPILGTKRIFFRIFNSTNFVYLQYPIIVQNFKKTLSLDSEKKMYKIMGPIWGKNVPYFGPKYSFFKNSILSLLITCSIHPPSKFQKKSSESIPREKCTRFWVRFGVKMSHFAFKKSLYSLLSL